MCIIELYNRIYYCMCNKLNQSSSEQSVYKWFYLHFWQMKHRMIRGLFLPEYLPVYTKGTGLVAWHHYESPQSPNLLKDTAVIWGETGGRGGSVIK